MVVYVTFLRDVACQKLLHSANVSRSYSQNNTGTFFLRHGVYAVVQLPTEMWAFSLYSTVFNNVLRCIIIIL